MNILFTSSGRRVELLRAFRSAYDELELDGNIVAIDIDPLAPTLQIADRYYIVPRTLESRYAPALLDVCTRESIDLIFPLSDIDIPVLAKHRTEFEQIGARAVVVDSNAADISADKWETFRFFQQLRIPVPKSFLPEAVTYADLAYPMVVKSRCGSGGKDVFVVQDQDELSFFLRKAKAPIVQEYLPGPEITSDVICDFQGKVLSVVSRQRIEVRWGEVSKGKTIINREIIRHCITIARGLRAIGPITVQCMMKGEEPCFTEVNPRYGGGAPLGIEAGIPSPCWYLSMAAGKTVNAPPLGEYQEGLYLTRHDDSIFLSKDDYERVSGNRI